MNAADVATWTPYFITLPQAEILYDSMSPAMQDSAFSDLFVFEDLLPAFRTLYRQHVTFIESASKLFYFFESHAIRVSIPTQEGCGE